MRDNKSIQLLSVHVGNALRKLCLCMWLKITVAGGLIP
jgi:hypothetical protein